MKNHTTSTGSTHSPFDETIMSWLQAAKAMATSKGDTALGITHLAATAYSLPPSLRREHESMLPGIGELPPGQRMRQHDAVAPNAAPMPLDPALKALVGKLRQQHGTTPVPATALLKALTANPVFVSTMAQFLPFGSLSETIHALDCYTTHAEKLVTKRFESPQLLAASQASLAGPFVSYHVCKTWIHARMEASSSAASRVFPFSHADFEALTPPVRMACLRVMGHTIKSSSAVGLLQLAMTDGPVTYPRNLPDTAEVLGRLVDCGIASLFANGSIPPAEESYLTSAATLQPGDGVALSPEWKKRLFNALAEEPPSQLEIDCLTALGDQQIEPIAQ